MMVGGTQSYHLSAPHGNSINDYINPDDYTLSHCSVDARAPTAELVGHMHLVRKVVHVCS